ncbi:MAG TPA: hypothetical protein DCP91_02350, partial [Eggerthellaceae bacterium]|nr:hypothetical protein [Eggerthellaceae bacterium]
MEVRDVAFAYGKNRVLGGVCMLVEQGKVTTVMGPNGCGKSTLFALMTKNLQPDRGKVFLRGRNIAAMGLKDFARQVSIVHQNNTAADDMTVEQLVELGRAPYRKPMTDLGAEDAQLVDWALQVTGTDAYRDRELVRLSGGQRQRVWIAMALAQNTRILFLDEPTTYLDVRYQIEILDLVRRLNREFGMTIVMVLHDINQAIAYSDVVVGLKDGAVSFAGDPNDLVTHESMRDLYGVDLEVMETRGVKHVLLQGPDARNAALAGAPQGPAPGHDGQTPLQAAFAPSISNAPADALAEGNPGVAGAGALPETATTGKPADSAGPGEAAGPLRPVPAWAPDYARAEAQRDAG